MSAVIHNPLYIPLKITGFKNLAVIQPKLIKQHMITEIYMFLLLFLLKTAKERARLKR